MKQALCQRRPERTFQLQAIAAIDGEKHASGQTGQADHDNGLALVAGDRRHGVEGIEEPPCPGTRDQHDFTIGVVGLKPAGCIGRRLLL